MPAGVWVRQHEKGDDAGSFRVYDVDVAFQAGHISCVKMASASRRLMRSTACSRRFLCVA
jgi:hypothetical protein